MAIPLDFPNDDPQLGDTYVGFNGTTYTFDGIKWVGNFVSYNGGVGSIGPAGPVGPTGPAGAIGPTGPSNDISSLSDLDDVSIPTPLSRDYLKYVDGIWINTSLDILDDSAPTLGGNLDINGNYISSARPGTDVILRSVTGTNILLDGPVRLGGILDTNGNYISSARTGTDVILRSVTGTSIILEGPVKIGTPAVGIDGSLSIVRNSYTSTFASSTLFAQHHETPDVVNFSLYRTRGNDVTPTSVQVGDDIGDIDFLGHNGVERLSIGTVTMSVDEVVTNSTVTGKLKFDMRSIDGQVQTRAELSSSGTWKIDKLSHLSNIATAIAITGDIVPSADSTYDLGSISSQWSSLHVDRIEFSNGTTQTTAFVIGSAPVESTSTGSAGTLAYDESFMYVCTATNAWQRISWDVTPW